MFILNDTQIAAVSGGLSQGEPYCVYPLPTPAGPGWLVEQFQMLKLGQPSVFDWTPLQGEEFVEPPLA